MRTFLENVTYTANIYYYITAEFDYSKCDSCPAAHGGVVLQRFEFIKVCIWKTVIDIAAEILIFYNNRDLPQCLVVFFIVNS